MSNLAALVPASHRRTPRPAHAPSQAAGLLSLWSLVSLLTLSACGGGAATDGALTAAARSAPPAAVRTAIALVDLAAEPPGDSCPTGGLRISAGLDGNADDVLGSAEVTGTRIVCCGPVGPVGPAGPTGSSGYSSLLHVAAEAAGANCPAGGSLATLGLDLDRSGTLQAGEVMASTYLCHGRDGAAGATGGIGLNGFTTLVSTAAEPAGSRCSAGGSRIAFGVDGNRNGVLEDAEVGSTETVCRGEPGATGTTGAAGPAGAAGLNSLLAVTAEPAGAHCAAGGQRASSGIDSNGNGVLDGGEAGAPSFVCNGATGATGATGPAGPAGTNGANGINGTNGTDGINGTNGSDGISSLVAITAETAGANCAAGGLRAAAGPDTNRNGVLDAGEITSASYVCTGLTGPQGATGPAGPPGPAGPAGTANWVTLSSGTVTAQAGTGYLVDSATRLTVTLPASPAVGDVFQVSGLGAGGWRIGQNAGQSIVTRGLPGAMVGTARDSARAWSDIATSADGTLLVAATSNTNLPLYLSSDRGATWAASTTPGLSNWSGVALSTDGSVMAGVVSSGAIYVSTDSGATWTSRDSARSWTDVALSADGTKMVAVVFGGQIYRSTDTGTTWAPLDSNRNWIAVASSADGTRLVAAVSSGQLYVSADSGATWAATESSRSWQGVASSADGSTLAAAAQSGGVFVSTDYGATWTLRQGSRQWRSVAMSADGSRIVATYEVSGATSSETLYSADRGLTWSSSGLTQFRASDSAITADGSRFYTLGNSTNIYVYTTRTTTGTGGALSGGQYESLTLQYAGGGV